MKLQKYKWYDTICIPLKCAPFYTYLRILLVFLLRLLPVIQIYATALFVDRALELLQKKISWQELIFPVALLAGLIVLTHLGSVFTNLLDQCIGNGIRSNYVEYLTTKCAALPYADIENNETWNLISRVKTKPDETMQKGLNSILDLAGIFLQIISFLAVLFSQAWWSVLCVLLIGGIIIVMAMKGGEEQYEARKEVTEYKRRYEYIGDVLIGREAAEERNLFQFTSFFQKRWDEYYQKSRKAELKVTVKWLVRMKTVSSSMALITFAVALTLLYPISKGTITIGLYISLIQAASSLVDIMSWELSDNINEYVKYKEYIKDFITFYNMPEIPDALKMPINNPVEIKKIELRNVSFSYPGTKKKVLEHINLKIEAGRHYAIVGGNGAGKTTLIKLLAGLYPDFEGDILFNEKSIRDFNITELKAMITVLFQDFARYEISVKDNIALGDIRQLNTKKQLEEINEIIGLLGMEERIQELPRKLNTPLSKLSTDGQELSGGEWQRIAMGRAMLSPSSLLILDEPTAALDPISESALYSEFQKISKGRTTLFISHRLGSTMLADEIIVLDEGRIVRQGSHDLLMEQCPLYKEMYENQRGWYSDE